MRTQALAFTLLLLTEFSPLVHASSDELIDPAGVIADSSQGANPVSTMMRASYISRAMLTGHQWHTLTDTEKIGYLVGYMDGVMHTATYYVPDEAQKQAAVNHLPTSVGYLPIEQLASRVDEFYADTANRAIPISFVLTVIRHQLAAAPPAEPPERHTERQRYIESLRQLFEEPAENVGR